MILKTVSIQAYYVILFIVQKNCIRFAQCPKNGKNGLMINVYSQRQCKFNIQFYILRKTVPISQNCTFFPNSRVLGNFQRLITQIQKTLRLM